MFDKINKFMRSKLLLTSMLIINGLVFVIGLLLNNIDLLFISGFSYATVLLSMYLNENNADEKD
tara:strand:- start:204 stop:395 length:192 start_codon:yes stop_codon:yes gene_type:complete